MKHAKAIVSALLALVLSGCAAADMARIPAVDATDPAIVAAAPADDYRIRPGDELDIKLYYQPELNETVTVRPDGRISLQLIDEVRAAGLTPAELDAELSRRYAAEVRFPSVSVILRSFVGQRIYVGGEVAEPQEMELAYGMTALQAIFKAGGLRETAYPEAAILIRRQEDGRPLPVRLDLGDVALTGGATDFGVVLAPSDVVYVPKSPIAKTNKFVQQYISDLFLYNGISLGFSGIYELNDKDGLETEVR